MNPNPEATSHYRRGTVFGLTVAEIFILLLFLLLILLAVFEEDAAEQRTDTQEKLRATQEKLSELEPWEPVARLFETPEEVVTLRRARDEAVRQAERHQEEAKRLKEVIGGEVTAVKAIEVAVAAKHEAEERAEQAQEELRVLRTKGQNPPCWYAQVGDGRGGTRERPHYTFNVGVFRDHLILRRADTPPGGAEDDNGGTYAAEADRLGLDGLPYDRPLDSAAFVSALQPIHDAGKNKAVRTYPCIFWVRVWDRTPANAKRRWQYAHDRIIEGLFGAYTVRNDPWRP